jgi:glutaredoxin
MSQSNSAQANDLKNGAGPRHDRWKSRLVKGVVHVVVLAAFLGIGLWAGPRFKGLYEGGSQKQPYVSGNYEAIYQQAGKQVVMFSKSTCPYCAHARELLTHEHVEFAELVVDQSPEAQRWFETLDGKGVPLLFIGDRRIVGFREDVIRTSLAQARH